MNVLRQQLQQQKKMGTPFRSQLSLDKIGKPAPNAVENPGIFLRINRVLPLVSRKNSRAVEVEISDVNSVIRRINA
jgi:hypothetical protein